MFLNEINEAGQSLWDARAGTPLDEVAAAAVFDQAGDLYVTGATTGSLAGGNAGSLDIFLIKYNAQKSQEWVKQIGTSDIDGPLDVIVDRNGDVYVVALSYSDLVNGTLEDDGLRDTFLIKYNLPGSFSGFIGLHWVARGRVRQSRQAQRWTRKGTSSWPAPPIEIWR